MSTLQEDDRLLIRDAVESFADDHYAFDERHRRLQASGKFGANWPAFADLGWLALPFAERAGGLGGGMEDVHVLMRAFGRVLITEPYAEVVLAGKLLEELDSELLAPVISGELKCVLAHGEWLADPGFEHVECRATRVPGGFSISGCKRAVWQAGAADRLLLTAMLEEQPALFVVPAEIGGLKIDEFTTIDSRYAADILLRDVVVDGDALLASGAAASRSVRHGILYAFAVLVGEARGIADALVAMTADFLNTREQFGARLSSFQALQHKLADMVIGAEEIRALEWLVAGSAGLDDPGEREKVLRSAKARVGKVLREMAEVAVQLHGGMGVSDELVIGHYLRRAVALDSLYGDSSKQLAWLAARS